VRCGTQNNGGGRKGKRGIRKTRLRRGRRRKKAKYNIELITRA
jgi:hypothetical protein